MKKSKLIGLGLMIAIVCTVATSVVMSGKSKVKAGSVETVYYKVSYNVTATQDTSIKSISLHYGTDGWNNVTTSAMERKSLKDSADFEYQKVLEVAKGTVINYCYKIEYKDGSVVWNNNNGSNWNVTASATNYERRAVTIYYKTYYYQAAKMGSQLYINYGINGWANQKTVLMDSKYTTSGNGPSIYDPVTFSITLYGEKGDNIDFCLKYYNGGEYAINNGGANYKVTFGSTDSYEVK